ncbi:alpha/beta fold hydrolase [Caulobacter rhizosphaerae]|uniref:alpha/beta fold hydrolase n=1 Tax=Caulobacter rhizosphaerae TaxID=2010972 RepID=UPI0013D71CBD|nr:alpha/beta hydrolase [Caulobacter rhizosphaerae]GGL18368.1 haloacetate dehalogenase [Caulobacter rhizosphaerae]
MSGVRTSAGSVAVEISGRGYPLLLLHGFPQTGLMWRDITPNLSREHTVVVVDLPGYGKSDRPNDPEIEHPMSKRSMGAMLVELMVGLGHERFAVAGHDRGGRVAYRMAMDHPDNVTHLIVMDVIPTFEVWARAEAKMALAFWPYSFLAQPAPLPETVLLAAPEAVVDDALENWGTPVSSFAPEVRDAYVAALRAPSTAAAICDEYRAASTIDRVHDEDDHKRGNRITCPTLALWDDEGGLGTWYQEAGGPLGIWKRWATNVTGQPMRGGHFFPEYVPDETSRLIARFLSGKDDR